MRRWLVRIIRPDDTEMDWTTWTGTPRQVADRIEACEDSLPDGWRLQVSYLQSHA